jgi:hypothetical protein
MPLGKYLQTELSLRALIQRVCQRRFDHARPRNSYANREKTEGSPVVWILDIIPWSDMPFYSLAAF